MFRLTKIAVVFASACTMAASFSANAGQATDNIVFDGSNFEACLQSTSELSVVLPYERLVAFQGALRTFTRVHASGEAADKTETAYQANDRVCKTMHGKRLPEIVAAADRARAIASHKTTRPVIAGR